MSIPLVNYTAVQHAAHAHAQSPCITHEQLCSLIEPTRTLYTNPAFRDGHGAALPVFRIRPEVANALGEPAAPGSLMMVCVTVHIFLFRGK